MSYMAAWLVAQLSTEDLSYLVGVQNISSAIEIFQNLLTNKNFNSFVLIPVWSRDTKSLFFEPWVHLSDLQSHVSYTGATPTGKTYIELTSKVKPFTAELDSDVVVNADTSESSKFISKKEAEDILTSIISSYDNIGDKDKSGDIIHTLKELKYIGSEMIPNMIYLVLYYRMRVDWGTSIIQ